MVALFLLWLNANLCLCELGEAEETEEICYHEKNDHYEGCEAVSIVACVIIVYP